MSTQQTAAPADGISQANSPELDTAMGGWGDGERDGNPLQGDTTQQQAAPQGQPRLPSNVVKDPGQQQQAPAQGQPAQPAAPASNNTDTSAAVKAAIEATAAAMSKNQGQTRAMEKAQTTMTEAEFAQRYGITKYDAKHLERLFDKDPNKAAEVLNEIQRNAYTSAVKMSNDLVQAALAQERATYAPRMAKVESFMAEQAERAATDRFYTAYPDLKPEADLIKEVLDSTQAKMARGELKFTTEQQAFQFVADATKKLVSRMTPASGTSPGGQPIQPATRQMAGASSAARPGGQKSGPKNESQAMLDSWDAQEAD